MDYGVEALKRDSVDAPGGHIPGDRPLARPTCSARRTNRIGPTGDTDDLVAISAQTRSERSAD